jgi:shikimate kinase
MEVRVKRVLITGMSGTGKSSVIHQLAAQGFEAVDLDSDEFSHWVEVLPGTSEHPTPAPGRDWIWREDRVQEILANESVDVLFVSGCAENMRKFVPQFDHIVLLSAPADVIAERLSKRTNNQFGKRPEELDQVMTVLRTVEPLLRKLADHEIDTRATLDEVVAAVLMHVN